MGNKVSAKERLFHSGITLFADRGFDSVSVREICQHAKTSSNMIHHYYGNKKGLFDAIVASFTDAVFVFPLKIIEDLPQSQEDFVVRMKLFFKATLDALIAQYRPLQVVMKHDISDPTLTALIEKFVGFLQASREQGFVRKELDPPMISGCLMDRLVNQVLYADKIKTYSGDDLFADDHYRKRWSDANVDLYLFGMAVTRG